MQPELNMIEIYSPASEKTELYDNFLDMENLDEIIEFQKNLVEALKKINSAYVTFR